MSTLPSRQVLRAWQNAAPPNRRNVEFGPPVVLSEFARFERYSQTFESAADAAEAIEGGMLHLTRKNKKIEPTQFRPAGRWQK